MRELDIYTPDDLDGSKRARLTLIMCDEEAINCNTLRQLQEAIATGETKAILVIPDYQYQKGLRGWAKVQILASVTSQIEGVMPLNYEDASKELENGWAVVHINSPVTWKKSQTITPQEIKVNQLGIAETTDEFDKVMMDRAKKVIESSNCWLDPAGSVFVRDGRVLVESTSFTFNHANCSAIPIHFKELSLNHGERMMFCSSLHAEKVGIAQAAKNGISLKGSTIYVTKFPCNPCAMDIIGAGITTVVFESDSYGLKDANLLVENDVELIRVKY